MASTIPTPPGRPPAAQGALGALLLGAALVAALAAGRLSATRAVEARLAELGFARGEIHLAVPSERAAAPPVPAPAAAPPATPPPTQAQIAARVGFAPKAPAYLPPGYQPGGFRVLAVDGTETREVGWRAEPDRRDRLCTFGLALGQRLASEPPRSPFRVGTAAAAAAVIDGAAAVWIERVPAGTCVGTHPDGRTESGTLLANILAWEHDGIRYSLMGDAALPRDELLHVAESLG